MCSQVLLPSSPFVNRLANSLSRYSCSVDCDVCVGGGRRGIKVPLMFYAIIHLSSNS